MAESKHQFDGIGKFSATLIFTSMAGGPLAFLTTGWLGTITFFLLKKFGSWLANQGLALLNIGVDAIKLSIEKGAYDAAIEAAIKQVKETNRPLTVKEKREIDESVKRAFRKFAVFV